MTLGSTALTTLSTVKARLGITDSSSDTLLEALINAASEAIVNYCGRSLHYEADLEEYVKGYGTNRLQLSRGPIWSIDSIFAGESELDADGYEVRGRDKYAGLVYRPQGWPWTARLSRTVAQNPVPGTEREDYLVTYAAGFQTPSQSPVVGVDALPQAIQEACIMATTALYGRVGSDPNVQSESLLSYSVTYGAADQASVLPPLCRSILDAYRWMVLT